MTAWLEWWRNNLYPQYREQVDSMRWDFTFSTLRNSWWEWFETLFYKDIPLSLDTRRMNSQQRQALIRLIGSLILHMETQASLGNLRFETNQSLTAESRLKSWRWIAMENGVFMNTTVASENLLRNIFPSQRFDSNFTFDNWQALIQQKCIEFWNKVLASRNVSPMTTTSSK